jgi:ribosomal protein S18 acetylase RimI-like enzyme
MMRFPTVSRREIADGVYTRSAVEADLPSIVTLLAQIHNDRPPLEPNEREIAAFHEILGSPFRGILVAEGDGLVGMLDLFIVANLTRGGRPWAGIENFVIDERHRRRGIGRGLLEVALGVARDAGCYKVQLVSHAKRDAAHGLYDALGFTAPVRGYRRYFDT